MQRSGLVRSSRTSWPEFNLLAARKQANSRLNQNLRHHFAEHIGQAEIAALEFVDQFFVIESQATQNRGLQIMHVHFVTGNMVSEQEQRR